MIGFVRAVRRGLRSRQHAATDEPVFARQSNEFGRAVTLLRIFYGAGLYFAISNVRRWPALRADPDLDPLWPVRWIDASGTAVGVDLVCASYIVAAFLVAMFPGRRFARAGYAIAVVQFYAVLHSSVGILHAAHAWIWVSILLAFLPDVVTRGTSGSASQRMERQRLLVAVAAAQCLVLAFYSLSGFWKIAIGLEQLALGEANTFAPTAFARHLVGARPGTDVSPGLVKLFATAPWIGWLPFLGMLYLEVFAIVAAFRPRLHRPFGLALAGFHLGTSLTFGIWFAESTLLVIVLLVGSPFARSETSWRAIVADLPLVGTVSRIRRRATISAPAGPAPRMRTS